MISEKCKGCWAYPMGWCEYDPLTDTVYPADEGMCLIARRENMTEKTRKTIDYLKSVEEAIENGYDECQKGAEELCSQETQNRIAGTLTASRGIVLMLQAVGAAIVCALDNSKANEHEEQEKNE